MVKGLLLLTNLYVDTANVFFHLLVLLTVYETDIINIYNMCQCY